MVSVTSGQYFFWPRAGFWSWVPKDQSIKVSAYRDNFQIINDIWTLEPPLVSEHCISAKLAGFFVSYEKVFITFPLSKLTRFYYFFHSRTAIAFCAKSLTLIFVSTDCPCQSSVHKQSVIFLFNLFVAPVARYDPHLPQFLFWANTDMNN